ncbi:MAG: M1 family aminopeptidase, partial [Blastocatellia bacterium]
YGGMENAGATFLNEDAVLFPSEPTANNYLSRAQVILHETAHQWFGDLVTMRWFDDLWLKEGFATFMAAKAARKVMPGYNTWKAFYLRTKPAAYITDSTKGTTPIWQEIRNLSAAKSAYGNIVYNKAPSMLHQAEFYLGSENFQRAIQLFVKEHAYGNARWSDLVGDFERTSGLKLASWADAWVKRRGMPDITVGLQISGDKITHLTLRQSDLLDEGGIWPMRLKVLLAYDDSKPIVIDVTLTGKVQEVKEAAGLHAPLYVFANYEDYGYGRFLLDDTSRAVVIEHLGNIKNDFLRALLWGSLWDSVRAAKLAPLDYLGLGIKLVGQETDEVMVQSILDHVDTAFNRYLSPNQQRELAPKVESLLYDKMMNSASKGLRITYFRAFHDVAASQNALSKLSDLLSGRLTVPGVQLRPRDRYDLIRRLLSCGAADGSALLEKESKTDKSDEGRRYSYSTGAAVNDPGVKKRYFDDYLQNREVPESWIEASLDPFNSIEQSNLSLPFLAQALAALPQMKRTRKIFFVNRWLGAFANGQCNRAALEVFERFLQREQIDRDLKLKTLEVEDGLDRCVRIREKYGNRAS